MSFFGPYFSLFKVVVVVVEPAHRRRKSVYALKRSEIALPSTVSILNALIEISL
jgi:hypothetical protein